MPNLLQRGATWLGGQLQSAAGQEVEYVRGSQSASVTGWPSRVEYEVDDQDGIPRRVTFYDWNFTTEDMIFTGETEQLDSMPGDQVLVTIGGFEYTYEAMPAGKRPVAEWLDSSGILRTVHTKLVKRTSA
jgi:hypothetical protein